MSAVNGSPFTIETIRDNLLYITDTIARRSLTLETMQGNIMRYIEEAKSRIDLPPRLSPLPSIGTLSTRNRTQRASSVPHAKPFSRIQTQRGAPRRIEKQRRTRKHRHFKRIHASYHIFIHDIGILSRRYQTLEQDIKPLQVHVQVQDQDQDTHKVIDYYTDIIEFYNKLEITYERIKARYEALLKAIIAMDTIPTNESGSNENSNENNEDPIRTIRFTEPSFHAIPHREDAAKVYLPAAMPAAPSSSGGKRTLRKKRTRRSRA